MDPLSIDLDELDEDWEEEEQYCFSLHLYGKPAWDLGGEGSRLTGEEIRVWGNQLREYLHRVGDVVEKLEQHGWTAELMLYDLSLYPPAGVDGKAELEKLLSPDEQEIVAVDEIM
jgi:hypothetical protein